MARARTNPIVKILVVTLIGAVVAIGMRSKSEAPPSRPGAAKTAKSGSAGDGTQDTTNETLKAFLAELAARRAKEDALERKVDELSRKWSAQPQQPQQPVPVDDGAGASSAVGKLSQQVQELAAVVAARPHVAERGTATAGGGVGGGNVNGMPVGLGYDGAPPTTGGEEDDGWIRPLDSAAGAGEAVKRLARSEGGGGGDGSLLHGTGGILHHVDTQVQKVAAKADEATGGALGHRRGEGEAIPRYTVPENSFLTDARAVTAIVGRVPRNGQVHDTYEFSVLTGADNILANNHQLPDLQGAIWRGTARGDETFSCVRGELHSVTFIFADGTVRTVNSKDQPLGRIADVHGNPCISGTYVSNVDQYLASRMGAKAFEVGAGAVARNETTTTTSAVGGTAQTSVTGNASTNILGQMVSAAGQEAGNFFEQRMNDFYDAVYTPAGKTMMVMVDQEIHIDYDPHGRKTIHAAVAGQGYGNGLD